MHEVHAKCFIYYLFSYRWL